MPIYQTDTSDSTAARRSVGPRLCCSLALVVAAITLPLGLLSAQQEDAQTTTTQQSETPAQKTQAVTEPPKDSPQEDVIQRLPLTAGTVSSNDVFFSVADEVHWIAGEVATVMKSVGALNSEGTILTQEQVEALAKKFPAVFELQIEDGEPTCLMVNKTQLTARLTDRKSGLRSWISTLTNAPLSKLTFAEETWPQQHPTRVVITLAGLHGFSSSADAIAAEIHNRTDLPVGSFAYPNDEPILQAATRFAQALDEFNHEHPKTSVTLVTHSMGGLVARAVMELENRQSQFGYMPRANFIDQIIMVCPPNHGSALSEYGPLLEGVEQLSRLFSGKGGKRRAMLLEMIKDGFNEAPLDLNPESEFLCKLNASERAKGVQYSILAGNDGPLRRGTSLIFSGVWDLISTNVDEPENLDRRIREVLSADELIRGLGDGVVAVRSAQLEAVDDFDVLPLSHLTWSQLDTAAAEEMLDAITDLLLPPPKTAQPSVTHTDITTENDSPNTP